MSSREAILGRIKTTLGNPGDDGARQRAVAHRIKAHPKGIIPARGQLADKQRVQLFCDEAEKVQTSIKRVKSYGSVPKAIADYLRSHNLPAEFCMGEDKRLKKLPWDKARSLTINTGPSNGEDAVGVSHAYGGIAESGTLLMLSGKDNPSTINFLPETHIVVVRASDIDGDYESLWTRIRRKFGRGKMPRTVNWITGPSRSGDIQQTILLGAHGPHWLHVIVVDE